MINWQFFMNLKIKLISVLCFTSCFFIFQAPNVDAKKSTEVTTDVMISYKNDAGKRYIIKNVTKVEKVLNKVEMVRASITKKQYDQLINNKNIEFINKSTKKMLVSTESVVNTGGQIPAFKSYWNLDYVKAPTYWKNGYQGKGVKVAVIDTGVNEIPDLTNVVKRVSFVKDNPNTKNIDESDEWDRGNYGEGHGTSVAAVLGAQIGGATFDSTISDVIGVAPNVLIYSLKYADGTRDGRIAEVIEAINWSIKHKMDLINISSSIYEDDSSLKKAVDQAVKAGIIIVASAGNDGNSNKPTYPARYSNVIAVTSIGKDKICSSFSNTGTSIDFTAPGDYVPTINSKGELFHASGTSFAAPHVTGLLAILKERYPYSTSSELIQKLRESALDLGTKGKDDKYGYGLAQLPKFSMTKPNELKSVTISKIKDHNATISYKLPVDTSFSKVAIIINDKTIKYTTHSTYTLKNLDSDRAYKVILKVINKNGDSSDGVQQSFRTLEDITPPANIDELKIKNLKIDSFNLAWINPIDEDFNETQVYLNGQLVDTTNSEEYSFKNLKPDTDYRLKLITEDTTGNISKGVESTIHTPGAKKIETPTVETVTTSSHTISGKATHNSTIAIKNGSKMVVKGLSNKDGKFQLALPFQAVGTILKVTAEDSVGNISKAKNVTVKQSKTTAQPIVDKVYTTTKYIRGKAELSSKVSVYRGKTLIVSDHVDSKGHFFLFMGNQQQGTILTVYVTNKQGVKSIPLKITVK
ncbi:S8 family serine peptidase [Rummeliibacillus pycnus]|uniref:S8 family serine peptidase n=1 Tax=Rummeliibacillus pycnus TaxID=101070 RepID=UPI0037C8AA15